MQHLDCLAKTTRPEEPSTGEINQEVLMMDNNKLVVVEESPSSFSARVQAFNSHFVLMNVKVITYHIMKLLT